MFLVLIYDCIKALYLIPCNLSKLGDTEVQSILASYRVDLLHFLRSLTKNFGFGADTGQNHSLRP